MKKLLGFAIALALSILAIGAQAQKAPAGKMSGKKAAISKMSPGTKPPVKKGVVGTSRGTVKGVPGAKSFVLTTAKGDVTVDTSAARYRNGSGRFVKSEKLTSGEAVEVTGQWKGRTLVASTVKLASISAGKHSLRKMSGKMGGKMGGRMSGTK